MVLGLISLISLMGLISLISLISLMGLIGERRRTSRAGGGELAVLGAVR